MFPIPTFIEVLLSVKNMYQDNSLFDWFGFWFRNPSIFNVTLNGHVLQTHWKNIITKHTDTEKLNRFWKKTTKAKLASPYLMYGEHVDRELYIEAVGGEALGNKDERNYSMWYNNLQQNDLYQWTHNYRSSLCRITFLFWDPSVCVLTLPWVFVLQTHW